MAHSRQFISLADAQAPYFVGVDVGGTNIKIGVVDNLGRPLSWISIATQVELGPDAGIERMREGVKNAVVAAGLKGDAIAQIGLGTPGTMDIAKGILLSPGNLPGWWNYPIRDRLSQACGKPVAYANDASAAAYGEYWVGSGRVLHSMIMFTLGTGVGGGIIIGDLNVEGENGAGAELGHMIIDQHDDARICSCGRRGHLEAYASASAVVKRTQELLAGGRKSSLEGRIAGGQALSSLMIDEEAERGDELSLEVIAETARYLAVGITSAMHAVDPTGIVIGGAMTFGGHDTKTGRDFLAKVKAEVKDRTFPFLAERTTIDYASLGGDAGYIGAAGLAHLAYLKN